MTSDQEGSTSSYKVRRQRCWRSTHIDWYRQRRLPVVTLLRSAASYAMGNGLTLSALCKTSQGDAEDDTQLVSHTQWTL